VRGRVAQAALADRPRFATKSLEVAHADVFKGGGADDRSGGIPCRITPPQLAVAGIPVPAWNLAGTSSGDCRGPIGHPGTWRPWSLAGGPAARYRTSSCLAFLQEEQIMAQETLTPDQVWAIYTEYADDMREKMHKKLYQTGLNVDQDSETTEPIQN
jgi:hypothetical protein